MREQSGITTQIDDKKAAESASRSDSTAIDTDNYLGKIGSGVQPTLTSNIGTGNIGLNIGPNSINTHVTTTAAGN